MFDNLTPEEATIAYIIRAKNHSAIPLHSTALQMNILLEGEWKYHQGKLEGLLKD